MNRLRRLLRPVCFSGKGLHTGEFAEVIVSPLPAGSSPELEIVLPKKGSVRSPLELCPVSGAGRGTTVFLPASDGSRSARTTEHLFAALAGVGLWSVRISLRGPEIPALDGCSARFAEALLEDSEPESHEGALSSPDQPGSVARDGSAGRVPVQAFSPALDEETKRTTQTGKASVWSPAYPVTIVDEEKKSMISLFPWRNLSISYIIQYAERPIGTQLAEFDASEDDFLAVVGTARTFALASEVESLLASGLARGGSLENALVVGERNVEAAGGLRFPDEFVRHKILDLLGDLYLLGVPLNARILAVRAGHEMHCRLVERLRRLRRGAMRDVSVVVDEFRRVVPPPSPFSGDAIV